MLRVVSPIELAIGFEPIGPSTGDVVIKLTMTAGRQLVGELNGAQLPLATMGTEVSVPDVGRRPAPEVVVVGAALSDPAGPVRMQVGDRTWNEQTWRALGPISSLGTARPSLDPHGW